MEELAAELGRDDDAARTGAGAGAGAGFSTGLGAGAGTGGLGFSTSLGAGEAFLSFLASFLALAFLEALFSFSGGLFRHKMQTSC